MSISVYSSRSIGKHAIAETSLRNKKGALYAIDHQIWWVHDIEDIYDHFYRFYFYAQIIQPFSTLVLVSSLQRAARRRQLQLSLYDRCRQLLSTHDLFLTRQQWCLA